MTPHPLARRSLIGGALAGAAPVLTGGGAARAAAAPLAPPVRAMDAPPLTPLPPLDPSKLRACVADLDHPAATSAQLRGAGPAGRWYGAAGAADLGSGRPVRPGDRFRAASVTKAFVATLVLRLAAHGRVELDAPVGGQLPGLLPPAFGRITVAQLLDHTSGLPDHRDVPLIRTPEDVVRHRFDRWTPREIVATVTGDPLKFAPGTAQEYRGVNYVLLALLVEEVTGQPYGAAIRDRVLRPLGLERTLFPGDDPRLHGPHVHNYLRMTDGSLRDVTVYDPSSSWGEGELVWTVDDLDRFLDALFSGELLPARMTERLFTLPPGDVRMLDGGPARYSMGLQTATVNGVTFWGKTGEWHGCRTRMFSTRDRRRRFVLVCTPTTMDADDAMTGRVVDALTGAPPR